MPSIVVNDLSKQYGRVRAVRDVSFTVDQGELFGLIGPDGAGKTSVFRMLTTLILPDGGTARVEGLDVTHDYKEIRKIVGYMPGKFSLYQDLSIEENLEFFATVFGTTVREHYHLISDIYVQLEPFRHRRAGKLSGGMKQKLALCCALIHKPSVLFLDEPTTGVDAVSRKEFWEMLRSLKAQGITILVSTPYMDEADLCERVALMHEGRILAMDTPAGIRQAFPERLYAVSSSDGVHRLLQAFRNYEHTGSAYAFGQSVHYTDKRKLPEIADDVSAMLRRAGISDALVESIEPDVEDSFMSIVNRQTALI